jgi:hypothetical protein
VNKHVEQWLVSGSNLVPGRAQGQSSYQSKFTGILGISVLVVTLVTDSFSIGEGSN